jgi:uncharacterized protein YjbI with pentapeptide repeats
VIEDHDGTPTDSGIQFRAVGDLVELRGTALSGLDLSHARLDNLRMFDVVLRNCRFDDASCLDWRAWGLVVEDCTFRRADLRDSALGTWWEGRGSRFRTVDFSSTTMPELDFAHAEFTDCVFDGAGLERTRFSECRLSRCRFTGLLDEVTFSGGTLDEVDFAAAVLRWTAFSGVDLAGITLPTDRDTHLIVRNYPCVVRRALALLETRHHDQATAVLRARLQVDAKNLDHGRTVGLWHKDELGDTAAEQQAARTLLEDAERECLQD